MDERLVRAETVVFDVGNVLLSFDPDRVLEALAPQADRPALREALWGEKRLWSRLDLGRDSNEAVADCLAAETGLPRARETLLHIICNFHRVMSPLPLYTLLPEVRQAGKRMYILSNYPEPSFSLLCAAYPRLTELMDGAVVSSRERIVKPDPAIFHLLMRRYAVRPENALFIDDAAANIQTAAGLGFSAWHYAGNDRIR